MAESLTRYAAARDDVVAALDELRAALQSSASWHGADGDVASLDGVTAKLRDGRFILAVVGEFSSGKSFLLNALLGKVTLEERNGARRITGLLATDINPSTATITELAYSDEEIAVAHYADGREERVPIGRLSRFVAVGEEAKLHDATTDAKGAPTLVRVGVDSAFLRNGFIVADTPGLASINPAHRRATLSYLPGADAVLYLIDTQQPFTDGDASFLGIVRRYIESIFIVQTKIDLWRMSEGGREAWQNASQRIIAQAAIHAPGTPVFPLSAREYAEGRLSDNDELIAQSRFGEFLSALDASLVATTGRSRLRRAAAEARRLASRAADALALDAAALEEDTSALGERRAALVPAIDEFRTNADEGARRLRDAGAALADSVIARGGELRSALTRTLARAFDIADIARLRDRGKLHIIVDDTLATAMGRFAADVAELVAKRLRSDARSAVGDIVAAARAASGDTALTALLDAIAAERLPITETAAHAFDADPTSGAWSTDLETGLRSTIVLGALGGPAVSLVASIAQRFAAAPYGTYMKRELLADLGTTLFPAFDAEIETFVAANAARIAIVAGTLGDRVASLADRIETEALGAIDRALDAHRRGADRPQAAATARATSERLSAIATRIEGRSESFARESRVDRREHADPATPLDQDAGTARGNVDPAARFDPQTYEHGLRPERWRVVVTGAFKRGKSSLINAIAGRHVLADETGQAEMRFPVHIRYGESERAYALGDDAHWDPIAFDDTLAAAARTPVLIEVPWHLPRELVLVHAPAFDSGDPLAEEIVNAAAASASEILALFSRQLSDRELELYGHLDGYKKPMTFVHTIADNEEPAERKNVVMLADRYLRERGIVPQRIFTTSTRTSEAWNELGALISTVEAHAEEHMERLRRNERERVEIARLTNAPTAHENPVKPPSSLIARLFRRG